MPSGGRLPGIFEFPKIGLQLVSNRNKISVDRSGRDGSSFARFNPGADGRACNLLLSYIADQFMRKLSGAYESRSRASINSACVAGVTVAFFLPFGFRTMIPSTRPQNAQRKGAVAPAHDTPAAAMIGRCPRSRGREHGDDHVS